LFLVSFAAQKVSSLMEMQHAIAGLIVPYEVEYPRVHPFWVLSFYIDNFERPVLWFLEATDLFY
jgi:hypothetical protein